MGGAFDVGHAHIEHWALITGGVVVVRVKSAGHWTLVLDASRTSMLDIEYWALLMAAAGTGDEELPHDRARGPVAACATCIAPHRESVRRGGETEYGCAARLSFARNARRHG